VTEGTTYLGYPEFCRLVAGDERLAGRLAAGEQLRVRTPFRYPGRRGAIVLHLTPGPADVAGPRPVQISDGGDLIRSLDEQGLDLSIDMVVSKTLVHAVKEVEGAGVISGEVSIDSAVDTLVADIWRFLQLMAELIGLRHAKYKDALLQLSRRPENASDLMRWAGR
jgi:hypothetical protein